MYVCLCRGVTERKVRTAIARGATTVEAVGDRCGAGTRCGGCWPLIEDMLQAIDARDAGEPQRHATAESNRRHHAA